MINNIKLHQEFWVIIIIEYLIHIEIIEIGMKIWTTKRKVLIKTSNTKEDSQ